MRRLSEHDFVGVPVEALVHALLQAVCELAMCLTKSKRERVYLAMVKVALMW
jgi:hypothetical protein